eukprot:m51a1_g9698 hypothetical protein (355) ;mRNA; r:1374907-1376194
MDLRGLHEAAARMCRETELEEVAECGGLIAPSRNLDPLDPPLTLSEYDMLERDRAKYLLYLAALVLATRDIASLRAKSAENRRGTVRYVVCGAGHGRLASLCLEAAAQCSVAAEVHCVDANPQSVDYVSALFAGDPRVVVHPPFVLAPLPRAAATAASLGPRGMLSSIAGACDVVVSELLGSFGDNEFAAELTRAACEWFLAPGGVCIPRSWSAHALPVLAASATAFLRAAGRPLDATYVLSLPPGTLFPCGSEAPALYTATCDAGLPTTWRCSEAAVTLRLRRRFQQQAPSERAGEATFRVWYEWAVTAGSGDAGLCALQNSNGETDSVNITVRASPTAESAALDSGLHSLAL